MKRNLILTLMFVVTIVAVSCGFQAPTYIPNGSGADVRNAINNALKAVMSQHSAPTEPSNAQPFMYWVDTSTTPPTTRQRNAANTAWDVVTEKMTFTGGTLPLGNFRFTVTNSGNLPTSAMSLYNNYLSLISTDESNNYNLITVSTSDVIIKSHRQSKLYIDTNPIPPATSSEMCNANEIRFDTNYMYRCVATDTWKRIPMSTW